LNIAASARPRVLLADDHIPFLVSLRGKLSGVLDIVGTASGGYEALELAQSLRPDVAVLDIAMPDCDGFEVLRRIRQSGLKTRVVFLTMHGDDEFATAAIQSGAHGYVPKSRTHVDLIDAIAHAVADRLFLPTVTSLSTVGDSRHAVQFHGNDSAYLDEVSRLARATLRSGEPFVLACSEATRKGVAERLKARQMDLALLADRGLYVADDSELAVPHVMNGGWPDEDRLADMIGQLEQRRLAGPNGPHGRLTLFGDMAVSLCRDGNFEAALELERIWDERTRALPIFTICAYPIECFEHPHARNPSWNVCGAHSAVVQTGSFVHRWSDVR
jgi:DNA-binding NarL/FixJ family response regulator